MAQDTANPTDETAKNQIETVTVDAEEIVEALRFNGQPEEYRNQRTAVLRVSPPFSSEVEASIHYTEEGTRYPSEMDPKPVHLSAEQFVTDDEYAVPPSRDDERHHARSELDNPTDEEIQEWVETAFEVWEDEVRAHLADELHETQPSGYGSLVGVDVEYEGER